MQGIPQGQTVTIDCQFGTTITIGCSWDKATNGKNVVDLDASVVMIDELGTVIDACFYN
jgi:stress response protein SCP2